MWSLVQTFMPKMNACYERACENAEKWKTYEETEEDKQVYEIKEC